MERFRARFEQKRGHFLVMEREPPLTRGECDEFQIRMLKNCDVPSFLKLDAEELDGNVSFRYALSGTRMLSQAMRTEKWSMTDLMEALCRLAEVLEDCRLYALDGERVSLDDDRIFVGQGWQDLSFVYLPVSLENPAAATALERLIVRWMVQVADLEGPTLQKVLRNVASPDFKPAALRRLAREYLAEHAGVSRKGDVIDEGAMFAEQPFAAHLPSPAAASEVPSRSNKTTGPSPVNEPADDSAGKSWRWFPPPAQAYELSGLLGDDDLGLFSEQGEQESKSTDNAARRRIVLVCLTFAITAAGWRWGYMEHPDLRGLLVSGAVTLSAMAAVLRLWNRRTRPAPHRRANLSHGAEQNSSDVPPIDEPLIPAAVSPLHRGSYPSPSEDDSRLQTGQAAWHMHRTQQLVAASEQPPPASYYLDWESGSPPVRVALESPSLVIGRSREACGHVDESHGVSRAHAELLAAAEGWRVKDLGSRNGSRLNGVAMVPYEIYPLAPDDLIDLAGSRYRFKHAI